MLFFLTDKNDFKSIEITIVLINFHIIKIKVFRLEFCFQKCCNFCNQSESFDPESLKLAMLPFDIFRFFILRYSLLTLGCL